MSTPQKSSYPKLLSDIEAVCLAGRRALGLMYWKIGERIVKAEQGGDPKAPYGQQLISRLSKDLTAKFGSGFSESHLEKMRRLYTRNRISPPAAELPLSHQIELLSIKDPNRRRILFQKAIRKNLSREQIRELIHNEKISTAPELKDVKAPKEPSPKLSVNRSCLYAYRILEPGYIHTEAGEVEEKVIDLGFSNNIQAEIFGVANLKAGEIIETKKSGNKYTFSRSQAKPRDLFTYIALVERVVDADTFWLNIDLGFKVWTRQKVRLRGIDALEISTKEGVEAKKFVEARLKEVDFVVVKTHSSDKYDRYLADIFYSPGVRDSSFPPLLNDFRVELRRTGVIREGKFLNQELLDNRLAVLWKE